MPSSKRNILYFRCSDGRCRRPEDIREQCVHQIRLPGGILFAELCAKHANKRIVRFMVEKVVMFAIEIMIKLKSPDEIIIASHHDCGAAADLGLSTDQIKRKHASLARKLERKFRNINVRALHEIHSESGDVHHGHEPIPLDIAA